MTESTATRRAVLGGAVAVGAGAVLAACASDEPETINGQSADPQADPSTSANAGGAAVAQIADVPVGGGVIVSAKQVVVTQPIEGEFKAFTAICPHQQCVVSRVEDKRIKCGCHGSEYSIEDGSVLQEPRGGQTRPLEEFPVTVEGTGLVLS